MEFSRPRRPADARRACSGPRAAYRTSASRRDVQHLHLDGVADVALVPDLRDGQQPRGRSRVAGREDQLALGGAGLRPLQVVRGLRGLAVFVRPEERDVEVPARVGEVVVVAAEVGNLLLGREHEAHVGVFLVAVEPVLAAAVEGDDLALQAGGRRALLLDRRPSRPGAGGRFGVGRAALHRTKHAPGDVLVRHEDVHLEVGALQFVSPRRRVEAVLHEVALGRGELRHLAPADVLVREQQPVGRHEGARAAVSHPRRRQAHVLEPLVGDVEPVLLLDARPRHVVEGPHALVGANDQGGPARQAARITNATRFMNATPVTTRSYLKAAVPSRPRRAWKGQDKATPGWRSLRSATPASQCRRVDRESCILPAPAELPCAQAGEADAKQRDVAGSGIGAAVAWLTE